VFHDHLEREAILVEENLCRTFKLGTCRLLLLPLCLLRVLARDRRFAFLLENASLLLVEVPYHLGFEEGNVLLHFVQSRRIVFRLRCTVVCAVLQRRRLADMLHLFKALQSFSDLLLSGLLVHELRFVLLTNLMGGDS